MDDLIDPNVFLIQFPIWTVIHPTAKAEGFMRLQGEGGEVGTPLFTDNDLAQQFLQSAKELAHYVLGCINSPPDLLPLLDILERKGFTHVTIDHTKRGAMFFSIAQLRASTQGAGG
jgi:hypothetical protein